MRSSLCVRSLSARAARSYSEFLVGDAAHTSQQSSITVSPLHKLYSKLLRELAQSEHSAIVHTRRESRRLGDTPPAHALRALGAHAASMKPRYMALLAKRQPIGRVAGRTVGEMFSTLRHLIFDRQIDAERSYRGTLLGFHHGIGVARLLRDVAARFEDEHMVNFCDDLLADRVPLVDAAERQLRWFADAPAKAIASGLRLAVASPNE